MTGTLIRKLLRDLRAALIVVALLLGAFQCLWAKITARISGELFPTFSRYIPESELKNVLFGGPGKLLQTFMGGENIELGRAMDILSIGYVHPLVQTILCIWAVGRASGAIAGEIDRGTMELLLAQPIPRYRVVLAHLAVDALTIPVLCLSLWAGISLGAWLVSPIEVPPPDPKAAPQTVPITPTLSLPMEIFQPKQRPNAEELLQLHPAAFGPPLLNVAGLLFAISGYTMWLSARGRFRWRVMGVAVLVTLLQFLANVVGQLWGALAWLRPFTVFFYYQPQQIILQGRWTVDLGQAWNDGQPLFAVPGVLVLFLVGAVGYGLALGAFCRRDLPAPL